MHSLHAYFLRPGDPRVPILYEVDRIRDGQSFTTRRVVAIQHGRPIFNMSVSFHVVEDGYDHQMPMPTDVPDGTGGVCAKAGVASAVITAGANAGGVEMEPDVSEDVLGAVQQETAAVLAHKREEVAWKLDRDRA